MRFKSYFCLLFFIIQCSSQNSEWFRRLPNQKLPIEEIPLGKYQKKIFSRAPLNSPNIFHENREEIFLLSGMQFSRFYLSKWKQGSFEREFQISAKGYYQKNGKWVLLTTTQIHYEFFENQSKIQERKVDVKSSLLYYFWKNEKVLVPMLYEKGFEEKNFGVKDGVSIPYDDSNPIFLRYLRFYTYEEYQSHGYFLTQEDK